MAWRRSAVKIYRALLFVYPAEFRHEYAVEMEQVFEDRLAHEPRLRVWLDVLMDLALTAPKEHLHILVADLRYAARVAAKSPAFTFVALLAMALGIGATTSVFSLINAVLIRSLPYEDPQRLVYIWTPIPRIKNLPAEMSPGTADFYTFREGARSFSELTMFSQARLTLVRPGESRRVGAAKVAGDFFETLGARTQLGRTIEPSDDQPGHAHVVVISDALRRSLFGPDKEVLGETLQLDREIYSIVGVMPQSFRYPHNSDFPYSDSDIPSTDLWIPAALTAQQKSAWDGFLSGAVGRLKPGASLKQAQAELNAIETRIDPVIHPEIFRGMAVLVRPFVDTAVGPVRSLLWLLLGAVSAVLLIESSNVANLLLARAAGRVHEMGVRTALGAERARLIRQMLTEAVMLALGGGALGAALAFAAVRLLVRWHPIDIPRLDETSLDAQVLLFTVAVSLLTGLTFGLLPALAASRVNVSALLKQGGNKGVAGSSNGLRNSLIVAEVAMSVVLLAAAGLLIRSFVKVQSVDTGFAPSTLTMRFVLDARYDTAQKINAFFGSLMGEVTNLPGVTVVGQITGLPLSHGEGLSTLEIKGRPAQKDETVNSRSATSAYFRAMGIPLLEGRLFQDEDVPGRAAEIVVSRSFRERYCPNDPCTGRELRIGDGNWHAIVGVVADVRHSSLEQNPQPTVYAPFRFAPEPRAYLTVRSSIPPAQLVPSITKIARSLDPAITPERAGTMADLEADAIRPRRFQTVVLSVFAGVAVFLALVGLYGLMAYAVKQRAAEIGIRIALGASSAQVLRMVLSKGLALTAAGLGIGLAGAFAVTRLVRSWLYGVTPTDPVTFLLVPAMILAVAFAACLIPAWRAARIDPVASLRSE